MQGAYLPTPYRGDARDKQTLAAWLQLIEHDKSNPQARHPYCAPRGRAHHAPGLTPPAAAAHPARGHAAQKLPAEDLRRRVALSINQCLAALPLYPDAWFDAAQWHGDLGDRAGEIRMLQRGLEMLPDCLLLHFALAEKHEVKGDAEAAKRVYEELCERRPSPLAFIHYMRFARRAESVNASRAVFKRARKSGLGCSWEVFCDAALREHRINKDQNVARNVFEMGLKHYGTEVPYVLQYLDWLMTFNDTDNNTRVVFEKVLSEENGLDKQQALVVWDRFWEFEVSRGDLQTIHKIEKRRAALYPELRPANALSRVAHRYRFEAMWPCGETQLELMGIDPGAAAADLAMAAGKRGDAGARGAGAEDGKGSVVVVQGKEQEPKRASVPLPPIPKPLQVRTLPRSASAPARAAPPTRLPRAPRGARAALSGRARPGLPGQAAQRPRGEPPEPGRDPLHGPPGASRTLTAAAAAAAATTTTAVLAFPPNASPRGAPGLGARAGGRQRGQNAVPSALLYSGAGPTAARRAGADTAAEGRAAHHPGALLQAPDDNVGHGRPNPGCAPAALRSRPRARRCCACCTCCASCGCTRPWLTAVPGPIRLGARARDASGRRGSWRGGRPEARAGRSAWGGGRRFPAAPEAALRQHHRLTCPISTEGWTRRVHFVREGGGGGGGAALRQHHRLKCRLGVRRQAQLLC